MCKAQVDSYEECDHYALRIPVTLCPQGEETYASDLWVRTEGVHNTLIEYRATPSSEPVLTVRCYLSSDGHFIGSDFDIVFCNDAQVTQTLPAGKCPDCLEVRYNYQAVREGTHADGVTPLKYWRHNLNHYLLLPTQGGGPARFLKFEGNVLDLPQWELFDGGENRALLLREKTRESKQ